MIKIESIFRIEFEDEMILQVLILCFEFWLSRSWYWDEMVNNNSTVDQTVATTPVFDLTWLLTYSIILFFWYYWNFRIRNQQGESQTGVWDPRESGIPGNQSQTRFPENESQPDGILGWMMGWFPIRILGFLRDFGYSAIVRRQYKVPE